MSVKILIDSSSDISQEEAKKLNISVIPMEITFEDEQFFDGIDLMPNEFYHYHQAQCLLNLKYYQFFVK